MMSRPARGTPIFTEHIHSKPTDLCTLISKSLWIPITIRILLVALLVV